MLQYMKHREHGTHIVYSEDEAVRCEALGWVRVDHPHDDPFNDVSDKEALEALEKAFADAVKPIQRDGDRSLELKDKTIPELKEIAEGLGIKIHPRAKENSIIKKILAAE